MVKEKRKKRKREGLRPSVAIKVSFLSGVVYLVAVVFYYVLKWSLFPNIPEEVAGFSLQWWERVGQIIVLATTVSLASRLYIENPINKLKNAINKVRSGNFNTRADVESLDEVGELASDFNNMLSALFEFNQDKIQTESELVFAKEELKYKEELEEKGKKIKEANKALKGMVRDFSILYEIAQSVNSTIDIKELYRITQDVLPEQLGLDQFSIMLVDEKREFLEVKAAAGFEDNERVFELSFRMGEGICGEAARSGEPIYVKDISKESRFLYYRGETIEKGSLVSTPLKYKRDVLGVMNCSRPNKEAFSEEEIRLLTMVANHLAMAVENAQLYTKTRELSVRDELTKLYNRRHFSQVMQMEWKRATRFRRPLSLLMVDIDRFKEFNDTLGHPFGDKVLKIIAELLLKNLREVDTIARFGGEEFVILLPDTGLEGAMVVAEKLRQRVEVERFSGEHQRIIPLTISVGVSAFPDDVREMDDLIDHADVALYEAKDSGRNRVIEYSRVHSVAASAESLGLK